jgi:TRAP-type mannitol/chloroaromatic compound transport system permease small subunit
MQPARPRGREHATPLPAASSAPLAALLRFRYRSRPRGPRGGPALHALEGFVRAVDRLNRVVGIVGAALIPAAVLLCAAVALLRYGFAFGRVWMQELYVVLAGVSFMILLARVHGEDGHVRVDIFWRRWSERRRALVDLLGNLLFVLPWTFVLIWSSSGFVRLSWSVLEPSAQAGGLPGLFLVKSVIPLAAFLLLLQGLAGAARALLRLAGRPDPLGPTP